MRRHITYANVAATLALVFAMTGGAIAAKHYLINSTKQINPKVLKRLRGNTGPRGVAGAAGAPGKEGPAGKQGAEGKAAPAPEAISGMAASVAFAPGKAAEVITEVKLPPGKFTLLAATTAKNDSAAPDEAGCVLRDNTNVFDGQNVIAPAKETAYIALPAVLVTVTAPSEEVDLACKSENTAEGAFGSAQLIATKGASAG